MNCRNSRTGGQVELEKTVPGNTPGIGTRSDEDTSARSARDRLLRKIGEETDLPALGSSVSRVVQMASSDDEAVRELAHFILSDVALTQKILRISNTVCYRTASGSPVTTVSKAIFLLGFDTVKTSALAMLLVDGMPRRHAKSVRNELGHALCASIIGREMARRSHHKDAEEAAIAALFKNVGKLLVAAHDHQSYNRIDSLIEDGHAPARACIEVLGCSFDLLAEAVLREWRIPEAIIQALAPLPQGVLKPAKSRREWVQQVAAFGSAAAPLLSGTSSATMEAATSGLLMRFGAALNVDRSGLDELFASVAQEVRILASTSGLALNVDEQIHVDLLDSEDRNPAENSSVPESPEDLLDGLLLGIADRTSPLQVTERHASGKPLNARDLLLAGVQDVTQMMSSGRCKANDLMLLVLETLYHSMGFRFATVCLKDIKTGQFRARIGVGDKCVQRQAAFAFPSESGRDLFHLAMDNNADLMISDASAPKIHDLLPDWHRSLLPDARSFIVLPLIVQNKQLGLFYADRSQVAPEGVPSDETALIKTLKGQVLTALNVH